MSSESSKRIDDGLVSGDALSLDALRQAIETHSGELATRFLSQMEEKHAPGLSFGIALQDELVFARSYGLRRTGIDAPVDAGTRFRIASMTKSFAAAAILRLRDEGALRLDDAVAAYIPGMAGIRYPSADAPRLTVRHLLSMSAGLPEDNAWADRQLYRDDAWLDTLAACGFSWSNPPGVCFEYSNVGYMLLGRVIAHVSGLPCTDYIDRYFLRPLGMDATVWNPTDVPADQLAHGYSWLDDAWQAQEILPSGGDNAAFAGLFTTQADMARWIGQMLLAWPPHDGVEHGPLRRSSRREMQQIQCAYPQAVAQPELGATAHARGGGYGFGLSIAFHDGLTIVGHGGGLPGYNSYMAWSPRHGIGLFAFANMTNTGLGALCTDALRTLTRQPQSAPRPVHPAAALETARRKVNRLINGWDDTLADALFADNFFLDLDREHWQTRLQALREKHGALQGEGTLEAENWLRGRWKLSGDVGECAVWISLTPTVPPHVQSMRITSTMPPSASMQQAIDALAALITHPTRRAFAKLTASKADRTRLWDRIRIANILLGPCSVGEVTAGDGEVSTSVRMLGEKRNSVAEIQLTARGKILDVLFQAEES